MLPGLVPLAAWLWATHLAAPLASGSAGIFGTYSDAVLPGLHVVEGGQTSTGSILNWYRRLVGLDSYKELNAEAAEVPLGCEGLTALDHFMGCRTPHVDARRCVSGGPLG